MTRSSLDRAFARHIAVLALVATTQHAIGAQTIAITGGKVYPVSGPPIENATVVIRDGKIAAVGAGVPIPDGAERVDATGKWVTPGLVNAQTELGLVEIGAEPTTRDVSARRGDNIAAALTVWDGLNPVSVLIAPARDEGITTVLVHPEGGLIAGQAALVDLVDGSVSDMVRKAPVGMVAQIGGAQEAGTGSRGELLVRLREVLEDARVYARRKSDFERAQTRPFATSRLDLEALGPVIQGKLPLLIAVDKASDIESALKLARDFELKIMIYGGAEAWMIADKLVAAKVPVLSGAMNNIPSSFSTLGSRQENLALLDKAGVTVAIIGTGADPEAFNVRNLKQDAGNAVAYGMAWERALRAVTLTPAELFGVADRIGSLQPGRDANVVVWSGDPFELSTRAERVFVHGRRFLAPSRQEQLRDRYRALPPTYKKP